MWSLSLEIEVDVEAQRERARSQGGCIDMMHVRRGVGQAPVTPQLLCISSVGVGRQRGAGRKEGQAVQH